MMNNIKTISMIRLISALTIEAAPRTAFLREEYSVKRVKMPKSSLGLSKI
jgi:hypothetical protein